MTIPGYEDAPDDIVEDMEEFLESLDKPVKWVESFGYNEHGICVEGYETVVSIREKAMGCVEVILAKNPNGWCCGYDYAISGCETGCSGGCSGAGLNDKGYATRIEALQSAFDFLLERFKKGDYAATVNDRRARILTLLKTEYNKLTAQPPPAVLPPMQPMVQASLFL